ncbi:MAG: type sorting protein [Sphingobacteriaceae bacterium]|nr:type sorting protein [Sphingobacteriaceae bacterium]
MKAFYVFFFLLIGWFCGYAQAPSNDDCNNAIKIIDARGFCGDFSNVGATEQFTGNGKDVWFSFVARNFEVSVTVTGALQSPDIKLYTDCNGTGLIGSTSRDSKSTVFKKGGLTPGSAYFISVSGLSDNTGAFKMCTDNYNPAIQPGQDFSSASLLCSAADSVMAVNVTGAGANNHETAGSCLGTESNSAQYRWTAANSGTLVFTITPSNFDDIDWVLYDLGSESEGAALPSGATVIRCAAGHGIDNKGCPGEPIYTKTGLDFNETDVSEQSGCGQGQNGVVKFVDMIQGHVYALIIDNFSGGNNGFKLKFTDRNGKGGTGQFVGPVAKMNLVKQNECTPQQSYTFSSTASGYSELNWYFGEGASISTANTTGPFNITYSTPGLKTVILQVKNEKGCSVVEEETFLVGLKPLPPTITSNKPDFCIKDTIKLSTPEVANAAYQWLGPNNYSSSEREPNIPVTGFGVSGTYSLTITIGGCSSDVVTINIPPVLKNPTAAFSADPIIPAKLSYPVTIEFFNESTDADTYLWDFGDGTTSTEVSPNHEYTKIGDYDVTLTAFKSNVCEATVVHGKIVIRAEGTIFIPNTFTPNGDGTNDEFVVSMINLRSYHIKIFNRWGEQLFEANSIFDNWNGLYNGSPLPVGTYYYLINAIDIKRNPVKRSGSVTIIR